MASHERVAAARSAYAHALIAWAGDDPGDECAREIRQLLLDVLDVVEQSEVEPAVIAAEKALWSTWDEAKKREAARLEWEQKRGTVRGPCVVCGVGVLHGEASLLDGELHCRKCAPPVMERIHREERERRLRRLNGW